MNLYYVEIYRNDTDSTRLHAELIMTSSSENAISASWEHFLNDISEANKASLTLDDVAIAFEIVTDVTALGENHAVYYTNNDLK